MLSIAQFITMTLLRHVPNKISLKRQDWEQSNSNVLRDIRYPTPRIPITIRLPITTIRHIQ